jgi:hypothetical protein
MVSLAVCEEGRQRGTGGVVEGRKDGAGLREKWRPPGGYVRLREGRKFSTGGRLQEEED